MARDVSAGLAHPAEATGELVEDDAGSKGSFAFPGFEGSAGNGQRVECCSKERSKYGRRDSAQGGRGRGAEAKMQWSVMGRDAVVTTWTLVIRSRPVGSQPHGVGSRRHSVVGVWRTSVMCI